MKHFSTPSATLHPHPLLGREGMLPDMIERETKLGNKAGSNREDHKARALELIQEFDASKRDILDNGIVEPLKVVKSLTGWLIADGRNRWAAFQEITALRYDDPEKQAAAKNLEMRGVPCVEITEEEVPQVILSAMTRRHMTKQARALMAVKAFPEVAEEAKSGRPKKSLAEQGIISKVELAAQVGVGLSTVEEACFFWRAIALHPKTREERMNQVFAGMSFERVLQGDTSAQKNKGQPRAGKKPWLLMSRNANSLKLLWKDYEEIEDEDKKLSMVELLAGALAAAPADVKPALIAALEGGEA